MASIYVHIPFCERKCSYCDFYSVGNTAGMPDFLRALTREITLRGDPHGATIYDTVFFGGGTPSLLTPRQLESILVRLHATFRIASHAEITLEANPGTVSRETLAAFRSLGVNRLSLGVQSFRDRELSFLGRIHDSDEALQCLEWSRAVGFENIGLDLMYAIPGQTVAAWEASLGVAVMESPQHIAAYALTVADRTPLGRRVQARAVRLQPAHREARMYERTVAFLAMHGYEHYEISNHARPGFRCRHNAAYWTHQDYLGLGPSAHSFWKARDGRHARRCRNIAHLPAYVDLLARAELPVAAEESVDARGLLQERILLSLRSSGLDLAALAADFGCSLDARQANLIRWLIEEDMATLAGTLLRLTSRGYLLCDEICGRLCGDVGHAQLPASRRRPVSR